MTLQDIKETKRYGRTDNVKTVYPPQTKLGGGGGYNNLKVTKVQLSKIFERKIIIIFLLII